MTQVVHPSARDALAVRGYVICSQQRSGTNYLCQLLESTGKLGRPQDYFNGAGLRARSWPDYPLDREAQLAAVLERGATPNGVYGLKMFPERFDDVQATRWAERLPGLRFVALERHDLLGQALSNVRAAQTNSYRAHVPATGPVEYDSKRIARQLQLIAQGQARWQLFFARNGIQPLRLTYEDIVAAPQAAVDAIARLVGIEAATPIDAASVTLTVQRDALTEEWRRKFLADHGDAAWLDGLAVTGGMPALVRAAAAFWRRRG